MTAGESAALDHPVAREQNPILDDANRFKLAAFCINTSRGTSISHAESLPKATWAETTALVQAADRAGIDGVIPLARWKNTIRSERDYDRVFETFTWAAGVAALTERTAVFATVHMPLFHPAMAAKMCATVDHISNGRFALNVVAGWSENEFAMFDVVQREHDERYDYADEWIGLVKRLWEDPEAFDFEGTYLKGRVFVAEPKPLQRPHPVIMSAGGSPRGRQFAAQHADLNFVALPGFDEIPKVVAGARSDAAQWSDGNVRIFGHGYIVCADTEQEARRKFEYVSRERRDVDGTKRWVEQLMGTSRSIDILKQETLVDRAAAGFFALPLVGTPEQVVEGIQKMADGGLDGMAVSFSDYSEGLATYDEAIRPLLIEAGLRTV